MTTIQTTTSSSTCSDDSSGRESAKCALKSAQAMRGLTAIVKGDLSTGGVRASFSPDPRAAKPAAEPQAVSTAVAGPAAKREHPPLTEKRVEHLLHVSVKQRMQKGMKPQQALASASDWLGNIIAEEASEEDKVAFRQKLDNVSTHPGQFWNAHYQRFPKSKPEKKPAPVAPKTESSEPQPKTEARKDTVEFTARQISLLSSVRSSEAVEPDAGNLLTLMSGVNQAGTTEDDVLDLHIPDVIAALPAPAPVASPRPAAAPQKTASKSAAKPQAQAKPAPKLRLLLKKPLTPGYVEEMMEYFEEGERLKGTPENRRRINACSYTLSRIEKDESSSAAVKAEFIKQVLALRPKQEPVQKPSLLDEGRLETLMQQAIDKALAKGWEPYAAADSATRGMLVRVSREVGQTEREKAHGRMKDFLQTFFVQPVLKAKGGPAEIGEAIEEARLCFQGGRKEVKDGYLKPYQTTCSEFIQAGRREGSTAPKAVETKPMTREEQEARAAEKKAERARRAEASATASRQIAGVVETTGEAKRRHRAKLAATADKQGKKGKQGGKDQRRQEARA